ncbi:MAG: hypothetical protein ACE5ES_01455 [Candidatus Nanoarchaeia archaeon]
MNKKELIQKITSKKEFSKLPRKDVEKVLSKFESERYIDEEKVKLTRDLLRKVFSGFTSQKLLNLKNRDADWVLKKHLSTRERFSYYKELYSKLLKNFANKNVSIIDLGCGVNGFSYDFFPNKSKIKYVGVEAVGQLVELINKYFKDNNLEGKVIHGSLFELAKLKELISKVKKPKVVFLFKTLDSLEMLEKDYSKKLLKEIVPFVDKVVVSFATRSMVSRKKFNVSRKWIVDFINEDFKLIDNFNLGSERYIVFEER